MELVRLKVQSRQQRLMSLLANPLASGVEGAAMAMAMSTGRGLQSVAKFWMTGLPPKCQLLDASGQVIMFDDSPVGHAAQH